MKKFFYLNVVPLAMVCFVCSILFYIGSVYEIDWLRFYYQKDVSSTLEMGNSVIPFLIGFAVGFLTEKIFAQHVE